CRRHLGEPTPAALATAADSARERRERDPCFAGGRTPHAPGTTHHGPTRLTRLSPGVHGGLGGGGAEAPEPVRSSERSRANNRRGSFDRAGRVASGRTRNTRGRNRAPAAHRRASGLVRGLSRAGAPYP